MIIDLENLMTAFGNSVQENTLTELFCTEILGCERPFIDRGMRQLQLLKRNK